MEEIIYFYMNGGHVNMWFIYRVRRVKVFNYNL